MGRAPSQELMDTFTQIESLKSTLDALALDVVRAQTCVVPGCGHGGRDPRDHGARMHDAPSSWAPEVRSSTSRPRSSGRWAAVQQLDTPHLDWGP